MTKYSRGAEWRRWDLHIHSNASDGKSTLKDIVEKAKENKLSVIALTDHHTAKNIDAIKDLCSTEGISVISGIEFRTEYGQKSVHIIGLFPDEFNNTKLTSKALHDLILSPLNLSETIIISKGKEGCSTLSDEQAFKKGMFLVQVPFKEAADKIHEHGGLVVVHAGSKSNSLDEEMKHHGKGIKDVNSLYESLGVVKEELFRKNYIDICEIRKENDSEKFYWETFRKPSIIASDAHETSEIGLRSTWIKADPTFLGLKQILYEPDRICFEEYPKLLERVKLNKTKYISELFVDTIEGKDDPANIWFKSTQIPLNTELVAIIGNKGSGKSAISDIIGLCADAEHSEDFLFLSPKKFIKKGFAERFCANLQLVSGTKTDIRQLTYGINPTDIPKVKYLPQHYFETVCNEIGKVESFRKEIEKVVFQYISDEKKLKKDTFSELISFKKESIDNEIGNIKIQIDALNKRIIVLEDKKNPEYKKHLESKMAAKVEELRVHNEQKPPEVQNPVTTEESPIAKAQRESLALWNNNFTVNSDMAELLEDEILNAAIAIEELNQFKRDIESKAQEINQFLEIKHEIAKKYSLNIASVLSFQFDTSAITALIIKTVNENSERKIILGTSDLPEFPIYDLLKLNAKITFCNNEVKKIKATLSQPDKEYQGYLEVSCQ